MPVPKAQRASGLAAGRDRRADGGRGAPSVMGGGGGGRRVENSGMSRNCFQTPEPST